MVFFLCVTSETKVQQKLLPYHSTKTVPTIASIANLIQPSFVVFIFVCFLPVSPNDIQITE